MPFTTALYRYKLHHVLLWVAVFGLWYYFRYEDFKSNQQAVLVTALKVADLALLVYITNYVLIPRLIYRRRYLIFGVVFILMIVVTSLSKLYLLASIMDIPRALIFDSSLKVRIYDNVIPHFLLVSTGAAFKLVLDNAKAQTRLAQMAKEKAETELHFLKSQINPHFLFNSLNAVYFLIDKHNSEARSALHKFSDMLRYQLYELNGNDIPIEKEIGYIEDYVALQRLRHDENTRVHVAIDSNTRGCFIEPLLLIPFVENSFKHLSHFDNGRQNEVHIGLEKHNGTLEFRVRNTTDDRGELSHHKGGIGLSNVKRRLELLYPGKHQLSVSREQDWFNVHLKISIDK